MVGEQPLVERNLGAFEHRPNGNSILLTAVIALDQSGAMVAALQASSIERSAMRAERTIGPLEAFQMLAGCVFVREAGRGNVHANSNGISMLLCQVYNCQDNALFLNKVSGFEAKIELYDWQPNRSPNEFQKDLIDIAIIWYNNKEMNI